MKTIAGKHRGVFSLCSQRCCATAEWVCVNVMQRGGRTENLLWAHIQPAHICLHCCYSISQGQWSRRQAQHQNSPPHFTCSIVAMSLHTGTFQNWERFSVAGEGRSGLLQTHLLCLNTWGEVMKSGKKLSIFCLRGPDSKHIPAWVWRTCITRRNLKKKK